MPHRAGYFALAYSWDHHCREIFDSLEARFRRVERDLSALASASPRGTEALLHHCKKWHYDNELYRLSVDEVRSRQFVIESLGYRGYGVNRDLAGALGALAQRHRGIEALLAEQFSRKIPSVRRRIKLPREAVAGRRSDLITATLARTIGRDPSPELPQLRGEIECHLDRYLALMSGEKWHVNEAIFKKMFLSLGTSSMTVMKGSTGLHDGRPRQDLMLLANRNLVAMGREAFWRLDGFTEIGFDLILDIHRILSEGLDSDGGRFREYDFPDKNGVTFDFGNFPREVSDLGVVLAETARSFHHTPEFIYNLARSYYMLIGIHPFRDANGRVGRSFLNLLFLKKGLPPVSLDDEEEVHALPRYGGSMEDMHRYLRGRIARAIEVYFRERERIDSLGLRDLRIHNVAFDAGLHFRQIGDRPSRIEVNFEAYVIGEPTPAGLYTDRGRIVFPTASLLYGMTAYCGISAGPFAQWRDSFSLKGAISISETASEDGRIRVFDVDFIVGVPWHAAQGDYFCCSIVSEEGGIVFNNKGLNYSYRLDL